MIDRAELQEAARKVFPLGSFAPDGAASWAQISEMGWLMMAVPEDLGGLGLGRDALAVIHTELGRALVPGPVIAQMIVIDALCAAPSSARDDLLARAMSGEMMTASLAGDGFMSCVPDADKASQVLVIADDRMTLHPLDGATITPRETWDKTRRMFDVTVANDGILMTNDPATVERIKANMLFALAGDSLGGAAAILDLTIDYLKTRRQFDRPLAMFQALKHRASDLKMQHAAAEALFWSRAHNATTLVQMGALKAHAARVYADIAEDAIQLHGGIGLTSEYHCHFFLKRALLNAALAGDADHWNETAGRARMEELT